VTLSKSARYALYAALEMALAGDEPVTVSGVAARHAIPPTALAKVFQQLVRVGLATSARGIGGGYRLARPRSAISVLDVMAVFDPPRPPGQDLLPDRRRRSDTLVDDGLRRLFDEVDEIVRCTYASVTLDTLARRARLSAAFPASSMASS
jgi:Rrf2 family protein